MIVPGKQGHASPFVMQQENCHEFNIRFVLECTEQFSGINIRKRGGINPQFVCMQSVKAAEVRGWGPVQWWA